jgi:hypothetical protein
LTVTWVVPPPARTTELEEVSRSSTVRKYDLVLQPKLKKVASSKTNA